MSAWWIKPLIYLLGAALIAGGAIAWMRDYTDAQAAQESRGALCKAFQIKKCTDDAVRDAFAAREERMDRLEEANTANARALAQANAAAVATALAVEAQAERAAESRARLDAVSKRLQAFKATALPATVQYLNTPVPDDVLRQLDEVLQ